MKDEIFQGLFLESGKMAGLKNLGKTYFINETELKEKDEFAQ